MNWWAFAPQSLEIRSSGHDYNYCILYKRKWKPQIFALLESQQTEVVHRYFVWWQWDKQFTRRDMCSISVLKQQMLLRQYTILSDILWLLFSVAFCCWYYLSFIGSEVFGIGYCNWDVAVTFCRKAVAIGWWLVPVLSVILMEHLFDKLINVLIF